MTVRQMIDLLNQAIEQGDLDESAVVRLWTQPTYPMTYRAGLAIDESEGDTILYVTEEGDQEYGPRDLTDLEDLL